MAETDAPDGFYSACLNLRYDGDCHDESHGGHLWDGQNWRYRDRAFETYLANVNGDNRGGRCRDGSHR